MSVVSPDMVALVKELGFAGIAIYALYVMNGLQNSMKSLEVVIAKLCEKVES